MLESLAHANLQATLPKVLKIWPRFQLPMHLDTFLPGLHQGMVRLARQKAAPQFHAVRHVLQKGWTARHLTQNGIMLFSRHAN